MMADEFGGEIPVGPFALIGDDSIGAGIVDDPARQPLPGRADAQPRPVHDRPGRPRGGQGRRDVEDVARTVHIARQLGEPMPIAAERHRRACTTATRTSTASDRRRTTQHDRTDRQPRRRSGSSPAASTCTAPETLAAGRRAVAADRRDARRRRRRSRSRSSGSRCSPTPTRSGACMLEANADDRLRRRDRLDAHVLARPRCGSPASTRCASRCCTCTPRPTATLPWATIDMDFMNLNQAAHGDREFGYIQTRLGVRPQDRRRPRQRPAASPSGSAAGRGPPRAAPRCARCGWPGSATTCATSPSPRATRSRPSCGSASRSTPTASTTWSRVVDAVGRRRRRRAGRRVRATSTTSPPSCGAAATGTSRCATAPRIELGLRHVPRPTAASAPSPRTSRTSAACASCPAWPCSG